jgi:type IV pilus assembly protein PilX
MRPGLAPPNTSDERGFVLLTAVIFLLVLTILSLSSMSTTILEEKMTGSYRDRQLAFEAAEAALRDGERDVFGSLRISGASSFVAGCGDNASSTPSELDANAGLCAVETDGTPIWVDLETDSTKKTAWVGGADEAHSVKYGRMTGATALPDVANQPRYIVEMMRLPSQQRKLNAPQTYKFAYRITAVGFGRRASTRVVLQSVVTSS